MTGSDHRDEGEAMTTFRTTLWASGGNNVGIVVPEDVSRWTTRDRRVQTVLDALN
jgi:hypothetical protein